MYLRLVLVLALCVLKTQACSPFNFIAEVTSTIKDIPSPPDLSTPGSIEDYVSTLATVIRDAQNVTRSLTFSVQGTYCAAAVDGLNSPAPLQLLVHGSTYTKEYWDRGAWLNGSLANSWSAYATAQNYSTLSIDRLCNGASSHPDPLLDCQLSTSTESLHAIIAAIRAGNTSILVPSSIIYVGHSAGSIAGTALVNAYPTDIDTLVLTGYPSGPIAASGTLAYYAESNTSLPAPSGLPLGYRPAAIADPTRFGNLSQAYILSTNATARIMGYAGSFDPRIPELDFETRGASPLGEATYTGPLTIDAYKGRVIVLTGDLDGWAWADKNVIERTKARFPYARQWEWIRVPDTGHSINWYTNAPMAYEQIHQRLGDQAAIPGSSPDGLR